MNNYWNPYLEKFNCINHKDFYSYELRSSMVKEFAWAVPNNDAIEAIQALNKDIIEIGSGSGYWAQVLNEAGRNVIAFDAHIGGYEFTEKWFAVKEGSIENIKDHADKALMLCWPNYDESFAFDAAVEYLENGGDTLIYIGEGHYGCTANDDFHNLMCKEFNVTTIAIPQWSGIHDYLNICTRKK